MIRSTVTRLASTAMLVLPALAAMSATASAQSARAIEHSHGVAHARVCNGPDVGGFARCHAHVVTDENGNPIENALQPNGLPAGYGPAGLRSAYKIPAGAGSQSTVVAIVDAYGYNNAESDLAVYRSTYGLPACTSANGCFTKYNQNGVAGSYPSQNVGWAQETALDLDMVSASCPGCKMGTHINSPLGADPARGEHPAR